MIDLGAWATESYRVAVEEEDQPGQEDQPNQESSTPRPPES